MSVSVIPTTCANFCSHWPQRRRPSRRWLLPPPLAAFCLSATYVTVPGPFGRSGITAHRTCNSYHWNLLSSSNNIHGCTEYSTCFLFSSNSGLKSIHIQQNSAECNAERIISFSFSLNGQCMTQRQQGGVD